MVCMTKECLCDYKRKLEDGIAEYMRTPMSLRSTEAIREMISCWEMVVAMKDIIEDKSELAFNKESATEWSKKMQNADGSNGGHWTVEETNGVGVPNGIDDFVWNTAMNMMYSDYGEVAMRYGVSTAEFFADLAKAFLFDKDAKEPKEKLAEYYHHIVK